MFCLKCCETYVYYFAIFFDMFRMILINEKIDWKRVGKWRIIPLMQIEVLLNCFVLILIFCIICFILIIFWVITCFVLILIIFCIIHRYIFWGLLLNSFDVVYTWSTNWKLLLPLGMYNGGPVECPLEPLHTILLWMMWGGFKVGLFDAERRQSLGQLYIWLTLFFQLHTEKSFPILIKSNWNQIVFTMHRLVWNQKDSFRLVPKQSVI